MFLDLPQTFHSLSTSLSNNMELVPEMFFGEGSFLSNPAHAHLGLTANNKAVDEVGLPLWASSA